jgi:excisionase family DNA binding protein
MSNLLSIKQAAKMLCVSQETLRNWEKDKSIFPVYTKGGHRRYKQEDIDALAGTTAPQLTTKNRVAIYARVSTSDQKTKGDLERQVGRLTTEAIKRKLTIASVFDEVASGMNDKRPKLNKMMDLAIKKEIDFVLVEHKDRLSRFMFNYLVKFFDSYDVEIVWINEVLGKSYEQELVEDILSLMASFSSKIYSKRAKDNRKKKNNDLQIFQNRTPTK